MTLTWGQGLNQDCLRAKTERVILIFLGHWNTKCIVSLLISLPVIVCNSEVIYNKGFDFQHEFLNSSRTDHNPCVTFFRTRIANELRVSKIMPPMDLSITSLNLAGNSIHEYWIFFECMAYFILELVYHHDNEYIGIIIAIVVWTPWEDAKNPLLSKMLYIQYIYQYDT